MLNAKLKQYNTSLKLLKVVRHIVSDTLKGLLHRNSPASVQYLKVITKSLQELYGAKVATRFMLGFVLVENCKVLLQSVSANIQSGHKALHWYKVRLLKHLELVIELVLLPSKHRNEKKKEIYAKEKYQLINRRKPWSKSFYTAADEVSILLAQKVDDFMAAFVNIDAMPNCSEPPWTPELEHSLLLRGDEVCDMYEQVKEIISSKTAQDNSDIVEFSNYGLLENLIEAFHDLEAKVLPYLMEQGENMIHFRMYDPQRQLMLERNSYNAYYKFDTGIDIKVAKACLCELHKLCESNHLTYNLDNQSNGTDNDNLQHLKNMYKQFFNQYAGISKFTKWSTLLLRGAARSYNTCITKNTLWDMDANFVEALQYQVFHYIQREMQNGIAEIDLGLFHALPVSDWEKAHALQVESHWEHSKWLDTMYSSPTIAPIIDLISLPNCQFSDIQEPSSQPIATQYGSLECDSPKSNEPTNTKLANGLHDVRL